jgi:hypothetical protein
MGMEKFRNRVVREARAGMKKHLASNLSHFQIGFVWLATFLVIAAISKDEAKSFLLGFIGSSIWLAVMYLSFVFEKIPQKIYSELQTENDSFDWRKVEFEVEKFNIFGLFGWCVKIVNSKSVELDNISLCKIGRREGQERTRTAKKRFGYIDLKLDKVLFQDTNIPSSGEILFAITAIEPAKVPPVPPVIYTEDDRIYTVQFQPFAIEVEAEAETKNQGKLPRKVLILEIYPDGEVSKKIKFED